MHELPARLVKKEALAHDVLALHLKIPESERFEFRAGQYLEIILRDGRKRAFSLANAPHDNDQLVLHVRYVVGGEFSDYAFNHLRERTILRIRGPLGGFFLRDDPKRPVIFIAGGTGFAPIKSIIETAVHAGLDRAMHLYWGVRDERDLYLPELPKQWLQAGALSRYVPVLSEPSEHDGWSGRTGFVHAAVLEDFADLAPYAVYCCGPPVMVDSIRETFVAHGADSTLIYSDAFEFAYELGYDG